jgi:hypothetical protein
MQGGVIMQIEQKFQIGDQVDYIDPETRQWIGPADIVEVLWSNAFGFFLYLIENDDYASCRCDTELRLRGSGETSSLVNNL